MARIDTFIPTVWAARLLHALDKAHVATNLVNRDYEGEIKNFGDTVKINTIGAVTIGTYTPGTPISLADLSTTDQTLTIDQQKYFNFKVEDIDAVQARADVMDAGLQRAAYGLADVADSFLFGKLTAGVDAGNKVGSDASPITLTSANVYENIIKLRQKLDEANVPTIGRKIAVDPNTYALLLQDTSHFAVANEATTGDNLIVNGFVGRVGGFDVYETNNLVKTATSIAIVATVPSSTTYAEQILKTEAYRVESAFADAVKGLHVYGAQVTDGTQIAVLYSDAV